MYKYLPIYCLITLYLHYLILLFICSYIRLRLSLELETRHFRVQCWLNVCYSFYYIGDLKYMESMLESTKGSFGFDLQMPSRWRHNWNQTIPTSTTFKSNLCLYLWNQVIAWWFTCSDFGCRRWIFGAFLFFPNISKRFSTNEAVKGQFFLYIFAKWASIHQQFRISLPTCSDDKSYLEYSWGRKNQQNWYFSWFAARSEGLERGSTAGNSEFGPHVGMFLFAIWFCAKLPVSGIAFMR